MTFKLLFRFSEEKKKNTGMNRTLIHNHASVMHTALTKCAIMPSGRL